MTPDPIQMALEALEKSYPYYEGSTPSPEYEEHHKATLALLQHQQDGGWRPISEAPKDGTIFLCLIDGLTYIAKYDDLGRFTWCSHSNVASGASYKIHNMDGKRLLEETKEAEYDYQKQWILWKKGFDHKPTHWQPYPCPKEGER